MTSKTESFILDEEGMRDVSHSLVSMLVEISTPFKNDLENNYLAKSDEPFFVYYCIFYTL